MSLLAKGLTELWGTAVAATKLATARTINGVQFDGTANITLTASNVGAIATTGGTATGNITAPDFIQSSTQSTNAAACTRKDYVDSAIAAGDALQVSKTGDTMTGGLTFANAASELGWVFNTDYAKIGFKNTADGDTDSYMWFKTGDNGNEYFKWQGVSGANTTDWMSLKSTGLVVAAGVTAPTFTGALAGNAATATQLATARQINGTNFDGTGNITTANWGTARTLTIGNSGKSVNGGGNVAWTLDEIGGYHPGNILGDVGFSADKPSGAVISRRNGVNGNVIKFADGTIILTKGVTWSGAVNKAWGALFESDAIDLGFMEDVSIVAAVSVEVVPTISGAIFHACVTPFDSATGKTPSIKLLRATPTDGISVEIFITAIGRWR